MPSSVPGMMLWPHFTVQDVDATLSFYRDRLGFEQDLCLKDHGGTFLGSVEVGDTVIMFERPDPHKPPMANRGRLADIGLTILFPESFDLDGFYAQLRGQDIRMFRDIGNRPYGNRDFAVLDPDGYVWCSRRWPPATAPISDT